MVSPMAAGTRTGESPRMQGRLTCLILCACWMALSGSAHAILPTLHLGRSYTSGSTATVAVNIVPNGNNVDTVQVHMSFTPSSIRPGVADIHAGPGWNVGPVTADGTSALYIPLNKTLLGNAEGPLLFVGVHPPDLTSSSVHLLADTLVHVVAGANNTVPAQDTNISALPTFGINYQGQLKTTSGLASGAYNLLFMLFSTPNAADGTGIDVPITMDNVPVTNGVFSVALPLLPADFQNVAAAGTAAYLAVGARSGSSTSYDYLAPLQVLNPAPFAIESLGLAPGSTIHGSSGNMLSIVSDNPSAFSQALYAVVTPAYADGTSDAIRGENDGSGQGVYGLSRSGIGVFGYVPPTGSTRTEGVYGESDAPAGVGVYGTAANDADSYGVWGESDTGRGVYGRSQKGIGVYGESVTGAGIVSLCTNYSTLFEGWHNGRVFLVDNTGKVFANGGYQTGGADVAEFVPALDNPQPGDVVEIDPDRDSRFRLCRTANSTAVAGVISTLPGLSMGADHAADASGKGPQLALVGRVPVKASAENGPIRRGDLLVASSTPGHAMRAPKHPAPGTIIGKALSTLAGGTGTVKMLVMLR